MPKDYKELRGYEDFNTKRLLFNLKDDSDQRVHLYNEHPDKVEMMEKRLREIIDRGYLEQ